MDRRVRAINAGLRLCHANLSVSGSAKTKRTHTAASALTFGKDWLIYCTSLLPEAGEEGAWRRTFPENYTSVARIHRPTQFAQALGLAVCKHIGATGKPAPMKATFHGFKTFEVHRTPQIVLHGPVLYVDDPYRCIDDADTGWAQICSMIFDEVARVRRTEGVPVRHVVDPTGGGRGVRPARLGDAEGLPTTGEDSAWPGQRPRDDSAGRTRTRRATRDLPRLHLPAT